MGRTQEQVRVGTFNTLRGVKLCAGDENRGHGCSCVRDTLLASGMEIITLLQSDTI